MLGERLQKIQRLLAEFSYGLVSAFLHASMWCNSVCLSCNDNSTMRREFLRENCSVSRDDVDEEKCSVSSSSSSSSSSSPAFRSLRRSHAFPFCTLLTPFLSRYSCSSAPGSRSLIRSLLRSHAFLHTPCVLFFFFFARFSFPYAFSMRSLSFYIPLTPFLHVRRRLFFDSFSFPSSFSCVSFLHTPCSVSSPASRSPFYVRLR